MGTEREGTYGLEFDREISRRKVMATGIGILGVTILAMLLMWWMSASLSTSARSQGAPLTEVQELRLQQIEEDNELHFLVEDRAFPTLEWPLDVAVPGGLDYDPRPYPPDPDVPEIPRVQVAPGRDMRSFLEDQRAIQEALGWDDPNGRLGHIPLAEAVEKVLAAPPDGPEAGAEPRTGDEP